MSVETMLARLELVNINSVGLPSRELEDVLSRDRENTSGRPDRKRLRGTTGQKRRDTECDTRRHRKSRTGKHIRPPLNRYFPRIEEHRNEDVGPEEGRADPQERREDTPL